MITNLSHSPILYSRMGSIIYVFLGQGTCVLQFSILFISFLGLDNVVSGSGWGRFAILITRGRTFGNKTSKCQTLGNCGVVG